MEKLNELKGTSKPVEARHSEAALRPEAEQSLRTSLAKARRFVDLASAGDEAYAHIDPKNVQKVCLLFCVCVSKSCQNVFSSLSLCVNEPVNQILPPKGGR